ncbi:MAG TPA: maleylpyruvate isomerase family mycothiol-dependent enzyme [Acidimicrobiia bacterium]|nr:maleylpyruvate isomerase family mycothiol-dependent enzyme [Acidimicrobiia bacterium]
MDDLIRVIRSEAGALADAAERDLAASIARYDGWTELDLLVHTGSVHRRTTETIRTAALDRVRRSFPPDEEPSTVLPWFRDGAEEMADALESADPGLRVWGFGPTPGVHSWTLRMALETTVHRWDAQEPFGSPDPIESDLAVKGIDEFAALWSGTISVPGDTGALCLRATDTGDTWLLSPAEVGVSFARGEADERVSGEAGVLYRWLLGRADIVDLDASADPSPWDQALHALPDARR